MKDLQNGKHAHPQAQTGEPVDVAQPGPAANDGNCGNKSLRGQFASLQAPSRTFIQLMSEASEINRTP
jgi:hypothetical protein